MLFALGFASCKDDAKENVATEFDNPQVQWKIAKIATQVQETLDELFAQEIDVNIDKSKLLSSTGNSKAEQARISLINFATQMLWIVEALEDKLDAQGNTSVSTTKLERLYNKITKAVSSLKNGEAFSLEETREVAEDFGELKWDCNMITNAVGYCPNSQEYFSNNEIKEYRSIINTGSEIILRNNEAIKSSRLKNWTQGDLTYL